MNTLMKTTALAAALTLGASSAIANTGFGFQTKVADDNTIALDLVNVDADGFVAIYDYSGGEFGDMLGMTEVFAGANDDVLIQLDPTMNTEQIAAVIYSGEMTNPIEADAWVQLDVDSDS